jgi:hypothetical protein
MIKNLATRLSDSARRAAMAEEIAKSARDAGFTSELRDGRVVVTKSDGSEWMVSGASQDGRPLERLQLSQIAGRHAAE